MVRRWNLWKNPWDREYAKRGALWRGAASIDPLPRFASPPGPVLEVGCGDGKFTVALAAAGYRPIGLDFSRNALKVARPTRGGQWVQGDALRLPIRDGRVPILVARYVLGSMTSLQRSLAAHEMTRVLAANGVVLVEDFSRDDFRYGVGTLVEEATFERNQGILSHYFRPDELAALFRGCQVLHHEEVRRALTVEGTRHPRVSLRFVFAAPNASSGSGA